MPDRALFVADIFAVRVTRKPLIAREYPDIDAELFEQPDRAPRDTGRQEVLLDRLQLRVDDRTAVEGTERQRQRQRLDQKVHADGRTAGDDGEADPGGAQPLDRGLRRLGQPL